MNCQKVLSRLSAYQDGELSLQWTREMERHLENCTACRSELDSLKRLLAGLIRFQGPEPDPGFTHRIMAGLPTRPEKKYRLLPSLAYTLAVLVICAGGFLLEMSVNSQPASPQPDALSFSAVLAESRHLGLLAVHDSTMELFSGGRHEN